MNQLVSPDSGNTTSRSAQENAVSPSDVTVDIMKTLQDAVKRQVDNFCLDSDRLETHEIIGRGRVDLCRDLIYMYVNVDIYVTFTLPGTYNYIYYVVMYGTLLWTGTCTCTCIRNYVSANPS